MRELPLPGPSGLRVCCARPPRHAGPVALGGWWPSFGAGLTLAEARGKARAEAIERACAVFQGGEPRMRATFRGLGDRAVHPERWLLYSARQRRLGWAGGGKSRSPLLRVPPRFDEEQELDWSPVRSLTSGARKYLPTMALYFRYPVAAARRYCPADSNGLAAGRSRAEAALAGLLELVERDSVALWWYNRSPRPAPQLEQAEPAGEIAALLRWYAAAGREAWLLDLTSELSIPVAVAISRTVGRPGGRTGTVRRSGGPAVGEDLAFGFGAGLSMAAAARHALCEMAQVLAVRALGGRGGAGTAEFERWRRRALAEATPHLLPAPGKAQHNRRGLSGVNAAARLEACCQRLRRRGLEVLACDLTRAESPLTVVRIVVPGLRHLWPRLGPGRLYEGPVRAGWQTAPLREAQLNPVPLLL